MTTFTKRSLAILVLIATCWAPWLMPRAYSAVWQWSTTASSNASADPSINWREGQPPSSINDSGRAMMAALASYRDDISGLLTTGGTATAYTITTNQGLCVSPSTTPQDGQQIAVTVNNTNGVNPTLQADSCSAYPIQSSAGTAVPAASLIQGSPYALRFSVANGAWMLKDFYGSALTVPLGGMILYTGTTSPNSNFVIPVAQCLSTTTYAAYWNLLGQPASGSCPGGTFQVLDMRGNVPAGLDQMGGASAALRLTNSSSGCGTTMTTVGAQCANGAQFATTTLSQLPTGITSSTIQSISVSGNVSVSGTVTVSGPQGHSMIIDPSTNPGTAAGAGSNPWQGGSLSSSVSFQGSNTMSGSNTLSSLNTIVVNSTNTGGALHPTIQPTVGVTYLLRVL
ncbi:MAG TPA: hypothetical protein VEU47_10940 [Candidatus Cybelea sp.]|nr:hypothetical protein [Candidatus Cybelea sp.]